MYFAGFADEGLTAVHDPAVTSEASVRFGNYAEYGRRMTATVDAVRPGAKQ
jgi:hypothetical protein